MNILKYIADAPKRAQDRGDIKIEHVVGTNQVAYTNTFPARRYTYRHDTVIVDGIKLEGHIQLRWRSRRLDMLTSYRDSCVVGRNIDWLIRMNADLLK